MAKKSGKAVTRRGAGKGSRKAAGKSAAKARSHSKQTAAAAAAASLEEQRPQPPLKLPNVWIITKKTARTLWGHKKLFAGITLIYGFLNLGLAQGFAGGTDVGSLKHSLDQIFTGDFGFVPSSLSVFVALLSSAGNTTDQTAGAYQMILAIVASLAMIWALRQVLAGGRWRVRDAYYRGMYPLVPFLLVLLVVGIQLLPLLIGSTLYSLIMNNGIALGAAEKLLCTLVFTLLALWTLYMLSSSLFALYIVTLPDMTPLKALRSARGLVRHRRWTVLRKMLFLPVLMLLVALVVMLPIIIVVAPLARWVFFLLTMFALLGLHAYMYTLYRELLNE